MFLQWDIAQALWDVLFFISERFSTASCDDQTIVSEHPTGNVSDTFFPNGGVAQTYSKLEKYQKAKELQVIVLEKLEQILGSSHPSTLVAMRDLANTYKHLKEYQKAETSPK